MPTHEYTAQQALQLIMKKLTNVHEELAKTVQAAVDAGRDVQAAESTGKGKKKIREYRKAVPYTYAEAIIVALTALEAYFIAQPLFRNSCADNFTPAAVGVPRSSARKIDQSQKFAFDPKSVGTNKAIQIELRTETQLLPQVQASQVTGELYQFEGVSPLTIQEERENLDHLRRLLDFAE